MQAIFINCACAACAQQAGSKSVSVSSALPSVNKGAEVVATLASGALVHIPVPWRARPLFFPSFDTATVACPSSLPSKDDSGVLNKAAEQQQSISSKQILQPSKRRFDAGHTHDERPAKMARSAKKVDAVKDWHDRKRFGSVDKKEDGDWSARRLSRSARPKAQAAVDKEKLLIRSVSVQSTKVPEKFTVSRSECTKRQKAQPQWGEKNVEVEVCLFRECDESGRLLMMDDDTQANTTADTDMMLDELKDKSESTRSTRSTQGQGQGQGHVWVSAKDVMLLLHKRSSTVTRTLMNLKLLPSPNIKLAKRISDKGVLLGQSMLAVNEIGLRQIFTKMKARKRGVNADNLGHVERLFISKWLPPLASSTSSSKDTTTATDSDSDHSDDSSSSSLSAVSVSAVSPSDSLSNGKDAVHTHTAPSTSTQSQMSSYTRTYTSRRNSLTLPSMSRSSPTTATITKPTAQSMALSALMSLSA